MFGFVNPLLLFGLLGIAVPILIHLLMRQRPRPRPWAAMIWLRNAVQVAQRRYRLTNFLLLLLRCLIALLIALAIARPSMIGLGQGGDVVLVVDVSTSMGPTRDGSPLSTLASRLQEANPSSGAVRLITVGDEVLLRQEGDWAEALDLLDKLEAETFAGGLDRLVVREQVQTLIDMIPERSQVILVSDFRQDNAEKLSELLQESADDVLRLRVGNDRSNGYIANVRPPSDMQPGVPSTLLSAIGRDVQGLALQINDGPEESIAIEAGAAAQNGWQPLTLPPLKSGSYVVKVRIEDQGLQADNLMELPVVVRDRVQALVVSDRLSFVDVAMEADPQRIDHRRIPVSALGATARKWWYCGR